MQRLEEIFHRAMDASKNKAYKTLGHTNGEATIASAKRLIWRLTRTMKQCESCQTPKAKQKDVPKVSNDTPAKLPAERLFLDLSKTQKPSEIKFIGKSNWLMIVDELTGLKFSTFHVTKNKTVEPTCVKLQKLKYEGFQLKHFRCDNVGVNRSLENVLTVQCGK